MPTRDDEYMTSTQVAELLGVGPTSIKRWADAGLIPCVRTAGQHRRFEKRVVEAFVERQRTGGPTVDEHVGLGQWIELLAGRCDPQIVHAQLLGERAKRGSWLAVAQALGDVVTEVGHRWECGLVSIAEEHILTTRLQRALAYLSQTLPSRPDAPYAMLAVPEGEVHTLGLSLVEICIRELGWNTEWLGANLPTREIALRMSMYPAEALVLSASPSLDRTPEFEHQILTLGEACEQNGATLLIGGRGLGRHEPSAGTVLADLEELHAWFAEHGPDKTGE